MSASHDQDHELERQRHDLDAAQSKTREDSDDERSDERVVHDGKRQNARGERSTHESLLRERARDDEDLRVERHRSDDARGAERKSGDEALAREKVARSDADEALEVRVDRDARRTSALKEALSLVETEIQVVATSLSEMLASAPRDSFEGRFGEGVSKIHAASARMRRLLEDALDPGDGRRRYHDVGGSG